MLIDKLKAYAESGVYPFHMPGHKRQRIDSLLPYEIDLTEIEGFDYLHNPQGCIRDLEQKAARLFHAKRAFLLVNGTTGGLLSAIRAMTLPDDTVIIARNCHKSVYNAVELCGLNPAYLLPKRIEGTEISGSVRPSDLERLFREHPTATLAVITSPTYEGVCSDITALAEICHRHGARLLVDEAHGAHFPFDSAFPKPAIDCGADVAVVSLHKTLPSPTQTALLLTNDSVLEPELQKQLAVFESSSPSYLLMSGMEACLDYVENHSFIEYLSLLNCFLAETKPLQNLRVLSCGKEQAFDYDIGKLVITTYRCNLTGRQLADILRTEYAIETEMSGANYVIAMTSVCDTKGGFDRLAFALKEIDSLAQYSEKELSASVTTVPHRYCNPYNARLLKKTTVPFEKAADRVSLEYIFAYPPGIPLLVPGEIVSENVIETVHKMRSQDVEMTSTDKKIPYQLTVADL